jgi:hypothetical protein
VSNYTFSHFYAGTNLTFFQPSTLVSHNENSRDVSSSTSDSGVITNQTIEAQVTGGSVLLTKNTTLADLAAEVVAKGVTGGEITVTNTYYTSNEINILQINTIIADGQNWESAEKKFSSGTDIDNLNVLQNGDSAFGGTLQDGKIDLGGFLGWNGTIDFNKSVTDVSIDKNWFVRTLETVGGFVASVVGFVVDPFVQAVNAIVDMVQNGFSWENFGTVFAAFTGAGWFVSGVDIAQNGWDKHFSKNQILNWSASMMLNKQYDDVVRDGDAGKAAIMGAVAVVAIAFTVATGGLGLAAFIPALSAGISLSAGAIAAGAIVTAYLAGTAAFNAAVAFEKGDWKTGLLNVAAALLTIAFPVRFGGTAAASAGASAATSSTSVVKLAGVSGRLQYLGQSVARGAVGSVKSIGSAFGLSGGIEMARAWQGIAAHMYTMTKLNVGMNIIGGMFEAVGLDERAEDLFGNIEAKGFFGSGLIADIGRAVFVDSAQADSLIDVNMGNNLQFAAIMYASMPLAQGIMSGAWGALKGSYKIGVNAPITQPKGFGDVLKTELKEQVKGFAEEQIKEEAFKYGLVGMGMDPALAEYVVEYLNPSGSANITNQNFAQAVNHADLSTTKGRTNAQNAIQTMFEAYGANNVTAAFSESGDILTVSLNGADVQSINITDSNGMKSAMAALASIAQTTDMKNSDAVAAFGSNIETMYNAVNAVMTASGDINVQNLIMAGTASASRNQQYGQNSSEFYQQVANSYAIANAHNGFNNTSDLSFKSVWAQMRGRSDLGYSGQINILNVVSEYTNDEGKFDENVMIEKINSGDTKAIEDLTQLAVFNRYGIQTGIKVNIEQIINGINVQESLSSAQKFDLAASLVQAGILVSKNAKFIDNNLLNGINETIINKISAFAMTGISEITSSAIEDMENIEQEIKGLNEEKDRVEPNSDKAKKLRDEIRSKQQQIKHMQELISVDSIRSFYVSLEILQQNSSERSPDMNILQQSIVSSIFDNKTLSNTQKYTALANLGVVTTNGILDSTNVDANTIQLLDLIGTVLSLLNTDLIADLSAKQIETVSRSYNRIITVLENNNVDTAEFKKVQGIVDEQIQQNQRDSKRLTDLAALFNAENIDIGNINTLISQLETEAAKKAAAGSVISQIRSGVENLLGAKEGNALVSYMQERIKSFKMTINGQQTLADAVGGFVFTEFEMTNDQSNFLETLLEINLTDSIIELSATDTAIQEAAEAFYKFTGWSAYNGEGFTGTKGEIITDEIKAGTAVMFRGIQGTALGDSGHRNQLNDVMYLVGTDSEIGIEGKGMGRVSVSELITETEKELSQEKDENKIAQLKKRLTDFRSVDGKYQYYYQLVSKHTNEGQLGAVRDIVNGQNLAVLAEVGYGKTAIAPSVAIARKLAGMGVNMDLVVANANEYRKYLEGEFADDGKTKISDFIREAGITVYAMDALAEAAMRGTQEDIDAFRAAMTDKNGFRVWTGEKMGFLGTQAASEMASNGIVELQQIIDEFQAQTDRLTIADEVHKFMESQTSFILSKGSESLLRSKNWDKKNNPKLQMAYDYAKEHFNEVSIDGSGTYTISDTFSEQISEYAKEHDLNRTWIDSAIKAIVEKSKGSDTYGIATDADGSKIVPVSNGQKESGRVFQDVAYAYAASRETGNAHQDALETVQVSKTDFGTSGSRLFFGSGQYVGMSGTLSHVQDIAATFGMEINQYGSKKDFRLNDKSNGADGTYDVKFNYIEAPDTKSARDAIVEQMFAQIVGNLDNGENSRTQLIMSIDVYVRQALIEKLKTYENGIYADRIDEITTETPDTKILNDEKTGLIQQKGKDGAKARIIIVNEKGAMGLDYTGNYDLLVDGTGASSSLLTQTYGRITRHSGETGTRTLYASSYETGSLFEDSNQPAILYGIANQLDNSPLTEDKKLRDELFDITRNEEGKIITVKVKDGVAADDIKSFKLAKAYALYDQAGQSLIFGMQDSIKDLYLTQKFNDLIVAAGGKNTLTGAAIYKVLQEMLLNHDQGSRTKTAKGEVVDGARQMQQSLESLRSQAIEAFSVALTQLEQINAAGNIKEMVRDNLQQWEQLVIESKGDGVIASPITRTIKLQKAADIMMSYGNQVVASYGQGMIDGAPAMVVDISQNIERSGIQFNEGQVNDLVETISQDPKLSVNGQLTYLGRKIIDNYKHINMKISDDDDLAAALAVLLGKLLGIDFRPDESQGAASASQGISSQSLDIAMALAYKNISIEDVISLANQNTAMIENISVFTEKDLTRILTAEYDNGFAETIKAQYSITLPSAQFIETLKVMEEKELKLTGKQQKMINMYNKLHDAFEYARYASVRLTPAERTDIFKTKHPHISSGFSFAGSMINFLPVSAIMGALSNIAGVQGESIEDTLKQTAVVNAISPVSKWFAERRNVFDLAISGAFGIRELSTSVSNNLKMRNSAKALDKQINPVLTELSDGLGAAQKDLEAAKASQPQQEAPAASTVSEAARRGLMAVTANPVSAAASRLISSAVNSDLIGENGVKLTEREICLVTSAEALNRTLSPVRIAEALMYPSSVRETTQTDYLLAAGFTTDVMKALPMGILNEAGLKAVTLLNASDINKINFAFDDGATSNGLVAYLDTGTNIGHAVAVTEISDGKVTVIDRSGEKIIKETISVEQFIDRGFKGIMWVDGETKARNNLEVQKADIGASLLAQLAGEKLLSEIVNGITASKELGTALVYVLNIWPDSDAIAKALGLESVDSAMEGADTKITDAYFAKAAEVYNALNAGELSAKEANVEIKLLSTVRDILITLKKSDKDKRKSLTDRLDSDELGMEDIEILKSQIIISKAVNMSVIIEGFKKSDADARDDKDAGKELKKALSKLTQELGKKMTRAEKKALAARTAAFDDVLPTLGNEEWVKKGTRGVMLSPMMARAVAASA